jgi:DtxR family Mn-dependent transcriptional regulator
MAVVYTQAMENYIEAIWRLTLDGGTATTSDVARQLGVTAASTSYMFKKLAATGLVEYKEYSGVSLTAEGKQFAISFIRRHRIVERFLVEVLGVAWDAADDLSHEMEQAVPEEVLDRMHAVMGYPTTCPHGYPIPAKDGTYPELSLRPLVTLEAGASAPIGQVSEHDPDLLRYFAKQGLQPGKGVRMIEHDQVGQTYTLELEGRPAPLVIAAAVANHVRVHA